MSRSEAPRPAYLQTFAREIPDVPALVDGDDVLTWAAWEDQGNRLADSLDKLGIRGGDPVAVRMMNRIEWFVVDAALAKLGALRVAVSYRLRPAEVRYLLQHSRARAVFFDDDDLAALEPAFRDLTDLAVRVGLSEAPGVVGLRRLLREGSPRPRSADKLTGSIVYTSGTTGYPKGVYRTAPIDEERRELLRRMSADFVSSIPFRRGDRNLLAAPLNHAAGPSSALSTHARGGTVYVLRKFDPEEALRLIDRHKITISFLVPTMLNRIMKLPDGVRARYDVSSMRIITTGASVCPAELKERVGAYFGPCLYESYGSTETALVTIASPADQARHPDSCGRILDGVRVRIVDDDGRELPRGEVGEIYIKSPATIASYLGEEAFGADFTGDGYFSAGDVGRLDEDGYLYILDRKKEMIIAGGVNIYPAEVERVLCAHPGILDAAVFGVPDDDMGEQVHAVCERIPGSRVSPEELAAFAAERLATYKRPRTIEFTEELPRNAAGKILKRELRAPFWADAGRSI
jgi:long-chain acyl-CoA synthetase